MSVFADRPGILDTLFDEKQPKERWDKILDNIGEKKIAEALWRNAGHHWYTANELGVPGRKLKKYIREHKRLQTIVTEATERLADFAEINIAQKIITGNLDATKFYLQGKAKDRGYTQRTEVTGADGAPVQVAASPDLSQLSDEALQMLAEAMLTTPSALPPPVEAQYSEVEDE